MAVAAPRKTYTNKATGKLMYVGGGVVPAAIAAKLRKAAAARKPVAIKPKPINPLDAQVNAAIAGKVTPLQGMLGERDKQYGAEAELAGRANTALQGELAGLGEKYNTAKTQALAATAAGQAASQGEQDRANSFLQTVLGGFLTDQPGAAATQATNMAYAGAEGDLSNRTVAGQLALEQQAGNESLALQRGAAGQQAAEFTRDRLDAKSADQRTIQTQIAALQAQRPDLLRKYGRENEQMSLARQQLALDRASLKQNQSQFDASQLAAQSQFDDQLEAEKLANANKPNGTAAQAKKAKEAARGLQDQALAALNSALTDTKALIGNPDTPAGAAGAPLEKLGLKVGRDYIASKTGQAAELTLDGLIRYFRSVAGLAPNYAYFAIQRYDPAKAKYLTLTKKGGSWTLTKKRLQGPTLPAASTPTRTSTANGVTTTIGVP